MGSWWVGVGGGGWGEVVGVGLAVVSVALGEGRELFYDRGSLETNDDDVGILDLHCRLAMSVSREPEGGKENSRRKGISRR